jgi:hypothetical protein
MKIILLNTIRIVFFVQITFILFEFASIEAVPYIFPVISSLTASTHTQIIVVSCNFTLFHHKCNTRLE